MHLLKLETWTYQPNVINTSIENNYCYNEHLINVIVIIVKPNDINIYFTCNGFQKNFFCHRVNVHSQVLRDPSYILELQTGSVFLNSIIACSCTVQYRVFHT